MEATIEAVAAFEPGDVVEGKYRIERLIDEGGMGSIYHAIQEPLGRDVAIKVLKPLEDTPERRAHRYKRFFKEASISSKLTHPNTIVVLDYGQLSGDDEGFYLVMEFLRGSSLRELLLQRGALGVKLTLHIAMQIASSLADAHRQGVIHRDLKPPNVMVVKRGDDPYFVKVLDFGLVKELEPEEGAEELTSENALIGSPMYMAPERFLQVKSDSAALDVYALGIMMYEMLVGRPPFVRESDSTLHHIMMQHIQVDPPAMKSLRPDLELPAGLETIVMQCLAKDPGDRVGSMDRLLQLLRACGSEAGMAVPLPVEDTGMFPDLVFKPQESSSDALNVDETGDTEFQTVEDRPKPAAPTETDAAEAESERSRAPIALGLLALIAVIAAIAAVAWPTAPVTTLVTVGSEPAGASVFVGDEPLGTTPFETPMVLETPITLTFEKSGFETYHYRLSPTKTETAAVSPRLVTVPERPAEPLANSPADAAPTIADTDGAAESTKAADAGATSKPQTKPSAKPKPKPAANGRPAVDQPDRNLDIKLDR